MAGVETVFGAIKFCLISFSSLSVFFHALLVLVVEPCVVCASNSGGNGTVAVAHFKESNLSQEFLILWS